MKSALQQDLRPPLAVALTGATRLEVVKNKDGKEEYSPNPFTVTAYIQNIGTGTATNARITLNLPSGMEIVEGEKTVDLGDIPVGTKQYQVSWKVKVAPSPVDKTEKYGVTVVADNADEKTLEREIFIPKLENENAVKLEIIKSQLQDGSHINLNLKLTNISKDSLDMRNYAIRYYLTDEQPRQEKAINFYNMAINGKQYKYINPSIASNISGQFKSNLMPTRDKADSYIQIALGKNVYELAKVAPGDSIIIQGAVNNKNYSNFKVTNDYSFEKGSTNNYEECNKIIVYNDKNQILWGIEPGAGITRVWNGIVFDTYGIQYGSRQDKQAVMTDISLDFKDNYIKIEGLLEVNQAASKINLMGDTFQIASQNVNRGQQVYLDLEETNRNYEVLGASIEKNAGSLRLNSSKLSLEGKNVIRIILKDIRNNQIIYIEDEFKDIDERIFSSRQRSDQESMKIADDTDMWFIPYISDIYDENLYNEVVKESERLANNTTKLRMNAFSNNQVIKRPDEIFEKVPDIVFTNPITARASDKPAVITVSQGLTNPLGILITNHNTRYSDVEKMPYGYCYATYPYVDGGYNALGEPEKYLTKLIVWTLNDNISDELDGKLSNKEVRMTMNIVTNGTYIYDTKTRHVENYDVVTGGHSTNYGISNMTFTAHIGAHNNNYQKSDTFASEFSILVHNEKYSSPKSAKQIATMLFTVHPKVLSKARIAYTIITSIADMIPTEEVNDDGIYILGNIGDQLDEYLDFQIQIGDNGRYLINPYLADQVAVEFDNDVIMYKKGHYAGLRFILHPYIQKDINQDELKGIIEGNLSFIEKRNKLIKYFESVSERNGYYKYIVYSVDFDVDYFSGSSLQVDQSYYRVFR